MTKKNVRSLDEISDDIHRLECGSVFDIGDLLIEAKAQCQHGDWLKWLAAEFIFWSVDTAERFMKVARLAAKFRSLRNLRICQTTLYELADHKCEEELPAIIAELAKHATKTRQTFDMARRVIHIGIGRHRHGNDYPDATLKFLAQYALNEKIVAALKEGKPETDEDAEAIIDAIIDEKQQAELEAKEAEWEVGETILDGAPPTLPPPIASEPQKFGTDTEWAETGTFSRAVEDLLSLRTKPIKRLIGKFSASELEEAANLLLTVAEEMKNGTHLH